MIQPATSHTLGFSLAGPAQGELIALTHGWAADSLFTSPIVSLLPNFRFMLIDMPGYGLSATLTEAAGSVSNTAELLLNTLPGSCHLMSWSLSTLSAIRAAASDPGKKIRSLITICGSPKFPASENWPGVPDNYIRKIRRYFVPAKADHVLNLFFMMQGKSPINDYNVQTFLRESFRLCREPAFTVLKAGLDEMIETDLRPEFFRLHLPSLHIFGKCDRLVSCQTAAYTGGHPEKTSVIFEYSAHMPYLTEPQKFAWWITHFLRRITYPGNAPAFAG